MPAQDIQTQTDAGLTHTSADRFSAELRGFGPLGILAILVIAAGTLVTPLAVRRVLGGPGGRIQWPAMGYARPKSWIGSVAIGLAFGSAFKLLMKAVVMPLLGADPLNPTYHYLVGNTAALPGMVFASIVVAGFGEETVFRGYLFNDSASYWGRERWPSW